MKIIELDEVDSTNEYCKRENFAQDVAVIARRQTAGRGTKGRSFVSDEGGLYITVMRHYNNFPADKAFRIMINSCVAVCKTLEEFLIKPRIRWANDVLVGSKKICGTLIENTFCGNNVVRSIVGMGINVNNEIPEELNNIATSITQNISAKVTIGEVKRVLLRNLENSYSIADYKSYIDYFGKSVVLKTADRERQVVALDISDDGRLIIKEQDGTVNKISSAEVSLKL
ncbi:MAG: biotin--[acetyl-CoA-carboxylase] ligase [Clostridiales bacterium]|nr:biotin--[acetyl-CoA-carboxylase] ligase [Clostridiales bacterium]